MKKWDTVEIDKERAVSLAGVAGVPVPIATILTGRGLKTAAEIELFLNPRLSSLSDPYLLPGMTDAVTRIWQALENRESIAVYGDYDVDGIVSTALLVDFLGRVGGRVRCR